VPHRAVVVPGPGDDLPAVRTECHAGNLSLRRADQRQPAGVGLPLEVVPLPAPQGQGTLVERLLDANSVPGQPLPMGEGDLAKVELLLGPATLLLLLALGHFGAMAGVVGLSASLLLLFLRPGFGLLGVEGVLLRRLLGLRLGLGPLPLPEDQPDPCNGHQDHGGTEGGDRWPPPRPLHGPLPGPDWPRLDRRAIKESS